LATPARLQQASLERPPDHPRSPWWLLRLAPGKEPGVKEGAKSKVGSWLWLLVGFAFLLRVWLAARSAVLYPDGAVYLLMAEDFAAGEFARALERAFHPGYPALVAIGIGLGASAEAAGAFLSASLGALTLVPIARTAARLAPPEQSELAAGAAAGLAVLHSSLAIPAGEILAYPLSLFAVALALELLTRAELEARMNAWPMLGAGAALGLAYLARPDGVLIAGGCGAALLLALFRRTPERPSTRRSLLAIGVLILGFSIVGGPYIAWVSQRSGRLRLSLKKDPAAWVEGASAPATTSPFRALDQRIAEHDGIWVPAPRSALGAISWAFNRSLGAVKFWLLLLAAAGLLLLGRRSRGSGLRALFLLPAAALLSGHALLYYYAGYLAHRHAALQALLALPLAGLGLASLARAIASRCRLSPELALSLLVAASLLPQAKRLWRPRRAHKALARGIGASIRARPAKGPRVLIGREVRQLAFYAGARYMDFEIKQPSERRALAEARTRGDAYLVIYLRSRERLDPWIRREAVRLGGRLIIEQQSQRRDIRYNWLVYQLQPQPDSPPR